MSSSLQQLWALIDPFKGELLALALTLAGGLVTFLLRARVRLIWGRSNNSLHMLPAGEKRVEIYAEKFYLQNTGRKPATNVEFVLSYKPDDLSVWQPRQYAEVTNPDGSLVVQIPFIAPYELVIVDVVYIDKVAAAVQSVKCQDTVAKNVPFVTQRQFGSAFNMIALILFLLGIAFVVRLLGIAIFGA